MFGLFYCFVGSSWWFLPGNRKQKAFIRYGECQAELWKRLFQQTMDSLSTILLLDLHKKRVLPQITKSLKICLSCPFSGHHVWSFLRCLRWGQSLFCFVKFRFPVHSARGRPTQTRGVLKFGWNFRHLRNTTMRGINLVKLPCWWWWLGCYLGGKLHVFGGP